MHIFVRDGIIYFAIIFAANLMNTLIYYVSDLNAIEDRDLHLFSSQLKI